MNGRLIVVSVALLVSTAGCFGGDDDGDTSPAPTDGTSSPTPTANVTSLVVKILNYTKSANLTQPIEVEWSVEPPAGQNTTIPHTGVHWANFSVTATAATGPAAYGNSSGVQANVMVPATFTTSFNITQSATIYVRAHAMIGSTNFWSDEVSVIVSPAGKVWTVTIGGSPGGALSSFDPDPIRVKAGDRIQWKNEDTAPALNVHTASSTSGPASFDTGNINAGSTSAPIEFMTTGTYVYRCNNHQDTMSGAEIIVE